MDNKGRLGGAALTAIMVISVFVALTVPVYAAEEDITTLGDMDSRYKNWRRKIKK